MWKPVYHLPPRPQSSMNFQQDSTVCKACTRHIFRTEAIRCQGTCNGEFHAECSALHDWTCGKCKKENSIVKRDFDKLTSAVDEINKNLTKTDAKIVELQLETVAGKITDSVQISEMATDMQNLHTRFDFMERQMTSVSAAMTELKTTISDLESKIIVQTERQTKSDQIDITGVQETLKTASQLIVAEMTRTLDRLLEEKHQFKTHSPSRPEQWDQQLTRKSDFEDLAKTGQLEEEMRMTQTNKNEQEKNVKQNPEQHQKTSRLQELAGQFKLR